MAAPTRVSFGSTSTFDTSTSPKTLSVTVQVGDLVVVYSLAESASTGAVNTAPTGNGESFTQLATVGTTSSHGRAIAWSMTATAAGTYDITTVRPLAETSHRWGALAWVYRGSDGVGAVGAPTANSTSNSVTLTATGADSELLVASVDWNATDGASRTRRTVDGSTGVEELYGRNSAAYTWYAQRYTLTSSGSKTAGYSAPASQASAIIAVEVLGTASASVPPSIYRSRAVHRSSRW